MASDPKPVPAPSWHGPRGEWLVVIQFALFFAFVLAPRWNPWLTPDLWGASDTLRLAWLTLFGSVALAFGALGVLHIRRYLTPLPYPVDHSRLVTHGVYGIVRHPLYSSQLFAALGWTGYTLSLSHLTLLIVGFLFFDYKAAKEERWLTERHPEYSQYARRVQKLVPWIY
jgi:protein-S-isoprenylcysteine O-methyltransferase Ste14